MKNRGKCCLRLLGVNMCLASAITLGLGIADIVVMWFPLCNSSASNCVLTTPLALTWVGVGIWASIPVFINGIGAIWTSGHLAAHKGWFCLLSFMSAAVFTPALVVISSLEVWFKFPSGVPSSAGAQYQAMFGIEIAIAVIGFVLHVHAMLLLYYVCCCKKCYKNKDAKGPEAAVTVPTQPQQQQQQVPQQPSSDQQSEIDKMNIWSAYRFMNNGQAGPSCCPPRPAGNYYVSGAVPSRNMGPGSYYGVGMGMSNYQMPRQILAGGPAEMVNPRAHRY